MLELSFVYTPTMNFAMQQNHVPISRKLLLKNNSDVDIVNISVQISLLPDLAYKTERIIDIIPKNSIIEVNNVKINISPKYLSEITERVVSEIVVSVCSNNENIATEIYSIDILPFDQWGGISVIPEMLSAFVTPNYPAITKIIHRASQILEVWTGNPSLDAYQSRNQDRVKKQIAAIYEAIAEQKIVYCAPPASYELSGQRIRMCDTILTNRIGTCLDMSLLYVSCLEAIGVNPLIVVIKGHAFAGAWLIDDTFADSVNDDVSLITKRIANGINEILLVETTCMNSGQKVNFDAAVSMAEYKLADNSNFVLSIDVKRSRFAGIRPLPLRIIGDNGIEISDTSTESRDTDTPETIIPETRIVNTQIIEVTKQRLWERKLLDLSLRNNLLNIRLTKSTVQLISVNINLLEDALANGDEFQILPKPTDWDNDLMDAGIYQSVNQVDPIIDIVKKELTQKRLRCYLTENELINSLTNLYRSSRLSMEENGANTLYLALGLLKWYETPNSEKPRYAPILLLPIEIIRKSAQKGYVIRSREEETLMNISLMEMLRQDFDINIGGLENLPKDESGVDVKLIFNTIRKGIMNQTKWNVEEQAILGIFSFSKFIMWNDIHSNADKLYNNKIVKSLASGILEWDVDEEVVMNLDADVKPSDIALAISADSFQMEAICAASEGKSFILHGPPGTGKSQTITNIIVDALYKGKKVLFVAEKMAALTVVQKRLKSIGIDPFCLELHSNKSKKSAVLEQLKTRTEILCKKSPEEYSVESQRLHTLRSELSKYVDVLHRKQQSGYSLYSAFFGYNIESHIKSDYALTPNVVATLSTENIIIWRDIIEEVQASAILCKNIFNHPLLDIEFSQYTQSGKTEGRDIIVKYLSSLDRCKSTVTGCMRVFSKEMDCFTKKHFESLKKIANFLLNRPTISSSLLRADNFMETISQVSQIIPHGIKRNSIRSLLLTDFNKTILSINANKLLIDWNIAESKWFLAKYFAQNKITKLLRVHSLTTLLDQKQVKEILARIIAFQHEQQTIENKNIYFSNLLGLMWAEGECDWNLIAECCKSSLWLNDRLLILTGDIFLAGKMRDSIADSMSQGIETFLSIYQEPLSKYTSAFDDMNGFYAELSTKLEISDHYDDTEQWILNKIKKANSWLENIDQLKDWCSWNTARKKAVGVGLNSFMSYLCSHSLDSNQIIGAFDKALYKSIIDGVIDSEPILASFNGKLFEDKIRKFRKLTQNFEKLTREELFAKLASNIPSFVRAASQSSEVGFLQRNIRNNGRGTSIRKLFDTIPTLLTRMTPCMLMSPMSVAQYIDVDNFKFDLVIFDEASQMPTCEAVGAIARGRNVIVVGDPKQMPPTSFFTSNNIDEDNLDKEDLESILDDCLALTMPSKYLLWHYRSKHESLIAFSNSQYYENKLLTFPSPDDIQSKVSYKHIPGYYDKGKSRQNKFEAEAVVNEIMSRLSDKEKAGRSIGVVTFSSVQQTIIEDLLNDAFAKNPEIEALALECAEPIFVKNLENVQGDEQDVILFSVGYGPDKEGKVSLNFGPLNREGGWRRLNVAVSRARYEMKVFSTLRSEQIDLARTSSEGVAGLKAFLEYAEKGKNAIAYKANSQIINQKTLVDIIADKIRERGFQVNTNIGCSGYRVDIGIINPEIPSVYIMALLCDGTNYKAAKTVRDREIIQQEVLKTLGWNVFRVWSLDWWENPEQVLADIMTAIANGSNQINSECFTNIEPELESNPGSDVSKTISDELLIKSGGLMAHDPDKSKYCIQYQSGKIEYVGFSCEEFTYPERSQYVMRQINHIIAIEAPISRDRLCRKVLSGWGISRIGSRIDAYFNMLFSQLNLKYTGSGNDRYFWTSEQVPSEYMNYRIFASNAADIAPEEVSVAVKEILEQQISLSKEDLVKETSQLFGFGRLGTIVEASMLRGIDTAIIRGFAKNDGDRIVIRD